jgi:hypothetical protein
MRDFTSIYAKLLQVLYPPKGGGNNQLLRWVPRTLPYEYSGSGRLHQQGLGPVGSIGDMSLSGHHNFCRCKCLSLRAHAAVCPCGTGVPSTVGVLTSQAPKEQSMQMFSLVISLITVGSVVVTVNSKLLGGKVSFFQSMVSYLLCWYVEETNSQCVLGYALAPILLASIICMLVHNLFVRIPVSLAGWAWSVWGESWPWWLSWLSLAGPINGNESFQS